MIKLIIFDMDGVLLPTPDYAIGIFNKLLEKYNIKFTKESYRKYVGLLMKDKIDMWNKEFNVNIDFDDFMEKGIKMQYEVYGKNLKPNTKLIEQIENFKKSGLKVALASNSQKERVYVILELLGLEEIFDLIITKDDVNLPKPHPEIHLTTAEKLGVKVEECVVIEDSKIGITAAKAANMKAIALTTEYEEYVNLSDADLIIDNLNELNLEMLSTFVNNF